MAPICTRYLQMIFFLCFSQLLLANNPGKDFLITLNGTKLTGQVKDVSFIDNRPQLSFENDFGDIYFIHPATVYGFAFEKNGEVSFFESKLLNGEWRFLKVENKGRELSLYTSPERQLRFIHSNKAPIVEKEKSVQIWLQFANEEPFKIYRFNFRSVLKKKMASYPELVELLGKRGFKFRNLPAIVELYNKLHESGNKDI